MKSGGVDCLLEHLSIAQDDKASLIMQTTWLFKLFKEVRHLLQIKVPKASTSLSQSDRWLSEVEAFGTELVHFPSTSPICTLSSMDSDNPSPTHLPIALTRKIPPKYRMPTAPASKLWVIGSVEGVRTAPKITAPRMTYRQPANIFSELTIPVIASRA